jgi:uncharacterized protein (DUF433 family)
VNAEISTLCLDPEGRGKRHAQDPRGVLGMIAEPTGTDGRPVISKHTCVTGRRNGPVLIKDAYGCFLLSMVHWVNGRRASMALQGIRKISTGIVQDPTINSGRPIIEGTRVFVDRIIGHLEIGMSIEEICHEYDLTPEQVKTVKQLNQEQVQYIKGYADALENVAMR